MNWDYAPVDNNSGVLVQIDGTSYSAKTNSNGDWIITNIPAKTYSFTFSQNGYETNKRLNVNILTNPELLKNVTLARPPDFPVVLDGVVVSPTPTNPGLHHYLKLYGHYTNIIGQSVRIVLSKNLNVNIHDTSTFLYYFDHETYNPIDTEAFEFEVGQPNNNVFEKTDSIYVTAFPSGVIQHYFDVTTSKNYFTGFGIRSNTLLLVK